MNPKPAAQTLERCFLEIRSRLLDLAAALDRIDRGAGREDLAEDTRMRAIQLALKVLARSQPDRAEQIQHLFSLEYDPQWIRPITNSRV
jgi:hypothetical protein